MEKNQLITTFQVSKKISNDGYDKIVMVTKDENNKKYIQYIEKPKFTYYITKPEVYEKDKRRHNYISKDLVDKRTCEYNYLISDMIKAANDKKLKQEYNEVCKDKTNYYRGIRQFHLDTRFHGTDMNLEDYYIHKFLNKYDPEENYVSIDKLYFDIEVDSSLLNGFPNPIYAEAPVNILTAIDERTMQCFVLMLKYDHQGYIDTVNNLESIKNKLKEKYKDRKVLEGMKFIFEQFDEEIDLISRFFELIQEELKPDIAVA